MPLPSGIDSQTSFTLLDNELEPQSVVVNDSLYAVYSRDNYLYISEFNGDQPYRLDEIKNTRHLSVTNKQLTNFNIDYSSMWVWHVDNNKSLDLYEITPTPYKTNRYTIDNQWHLDDNILAINSNVVSGVPSLTVYLQEYNDIPRRYVTYWDDPTSNSVFYNFELGWDYRRLESITVYRDNDNTSLFLTYFEQGSPYNLYYDGFTLPAPDFIVCSSYNGSNFLTWTPIVAENTVVTYTLERDSSVDFLNPTEIYSGTSTNFNHVGVIGTTYWYRVKAHITQIALDSVWSDPCSILTIGKTDGLIKPIITARQYGPRHAVKDIDLKVETFTFGKLSYLKDLPVNIYANYTGSFQDIGASYTDYTGKVNFNLPLPPIGVNNYLIYALVQYNEQSYRSNLVRLNVRKS